MDLKEVGAVDPRLHWYYQAKLAGVLSALKHSGREIRCIVDVGAGSGFFSQAIAEDREVPSVICIDANYAEDATPLNGSHRWLRSATDDDLRHADLALFIDVLEHVDEDIDFLSGYVEMLPTGTLVVITVPAFMSLWSAHDEFLHHRRRYRLEQLVEVATGSSLQVLGGRYLFASILPAAWLVRMVRRGAPPASDLKAMPRPLNRLLTTFLSWEHSLPKNRLGGLSAMVVAVVP